MARRIVHVVLLFAGIVPAVWAVCIASSDPRRAGVLVVLAALGITINGLSLAKRGFGISVPLRVIACGVALAVVAGVMAMWQWIRAERLPMIPETDVPLRRLWETAAHNLIWIAAAVGYVILTVLVMRTPPPRRRPEKPARIDFRTYGRSEDRK